MAEFLRNPAGIGYLRLTYNELCDFIENDYAVCDKCGKDLYEMNDIIMIPLTNRAFCANCGQEKADGIIDYPEERELREKREAHIKAYFGL